VHLDDAEKVFLGLSGRVAEVAEVAVHQTPKLASDKKNSVILGHDFGLKFPGHMFTEVVASNLH